MAQAAGLVTKEKYNSDPIYAGRVKEMYKKVKPESWERHRENLIKWSKILAQTPEHKERCRKMGKKHGGKNAWVLLAIPEDRKKEICSKGGKGGGAKKAVQRGTHNWLSDSPHSPNNIRISCPDGFITKLTSAKRYCRNRGLNPDDCKVLQIQAN